LNAEQPKREEATVRPGHYQVLCVLALGIVFLIQLNHGLLIPAAAVLLMGGAAVLLRVRISPLLVLMALVAGQLYSARTFPGFQVAAPLQTQDVLLCAAALAYVAGHYRLLALWQNILPPDPRQRFFQGIAVVAPLHRLGRVARRPRPAALLSRAEIAWFVLQLPLFALLAQGAWIVVGARREMFDLPPAWVQLVVIAWGLVFGLLVARQLFHVRRLRQMNRATAEILLQDALWQETRGEQRRMGRWLAWWHLRRKPK
jgi:hypothetical protein